MTALQIPVKTTEPVQTMSTTTTAIAFLDLMEQTVKTVSTAITVFVSDSIVQNAKMRLKFSVSYYSNYL
jgi:hypothetical protein